MMATVLLDPDVLARMDPQRWAAVEAAIKARILTSEALRNEIGPVVQRLAIGQAIEGQK
jgi:hypothetical protein